MPLTQVYAAKVNGTEYDTVPMNANGSGAKNNGGATTRVGSGSSLLDNVAVDRYDAGVFGSAVLDNDWANEAVSAGTFAYNNQRPVAKRLTSTLSGVSNDVLLSGADVPSLIRSIHYIDSATTTKTATGIRENKYNRYTNVWASGYPQNSVDSFGTDDAGTPTRAVPGELVFKTSAPTATMANYSAKTG